MSALIIFLTRRPERFVALEGKNPRAMRGGGATFKRLPTNNLN